jgi:MoaA/NifB/PqqE/SkfB family radical SAM enzyme
MKPRVERELERYRVRMAQRGERLRAWERGNPGGPFQVSFHPTNACNLRCSICWQRRGVVDQRELPRNRQESLVDEAADLKAREFVLGGGGEPMMRQALLRSLMSRVKERSLYGLLFTNGTLLSEDFAAFSAHIAWDKILVSLDGIEEINDIVRQSGSYNRVSKGLRTLVAVRGDAQYPLLGVGCVLTRQSVPTLPLLLRIIAEAGCDQFNLIRLVVNTPDQQAFEIRREDFDLVGRSLRECLTIAEGSGMVTNIRDYLNTEVIEQIGQFDNVLLKQYTGAAAGLGLWDALCFDPFLNLVIQPNGQCGPCCMSGDAPIASIESEAMADVWFGPDFQRVRAGILRREPEPYCRLCDVNVYAQNEKLRKEGVGV